MVIAFIPQSGGRRSSLVVSIPTGFTYKKSWFGAHLVGRKLIGFSMRTPTG